MNFSVPPELDLPSGFGFTMRGWNFTVNEVTEAIQHHRMLNPAMELGTNVCPWNCDFCFTERPENPQGRKRRLRGELSLARRLELIREAASLGARSINFVGAGEPTIDPDFWEIVEAITSHGLTPIVYSEGALKLRNRAFAERLYGLGATIVLKVNSLCNREYQDRVVRGALPEAGVPRYSYSAGRDKALEMLLDLGFASEKPTRLAFDTIICRENLDEIESIHRFARQRNIFVLAVNFLPSGRTHDGHTSEISWDEQHAVFRRMAEIDREEFGIEHRTHFPYAGGVPCTIRGLGLYVKIQGQVFDCPGESVELGNIQRESLGEVWAKARKITSEFDGECLPRKLYWQRVATKGRLARHLKARS